MKTYKPLPDNLTIKPSPILDIFKDENIVTMYPNDVWEMYPQENEYNDYGNGLKLKSMLGRANLQHLIGQEGVIDYYSPLLMDRDNNGGWWNIKFDNDVAVPRGLQGFTNDEIELI